MIHVLFFGMPYAYWLTFRLILLESMLQEQGNNIELKKRNDHKRLGIHLVCSFLWTKLKRKTVDSSQITRRLLLVFSYNLLRRDTNYDFTLQVGPI
jgi:hypothetical protein